MTAKKPKPAKRTTRKRKTAKRASAKPARNVRETGLRIEYVPLSSLEPAKRNPKAHSSDLGTSVDRWGFADAPILDGRTGRLVAGHGRREALLQRHAEGKAPPENVKLSEDGDWLVPVQAGWSSKDDHEAEAFLLAHNKLTEAGGWDQEELAKAVRDLKTAEVDLSGIGFDAKELSALAASLNVAPGGDPGATDPPAKPKSKRGDIYELGPHRLVCGDCRAEAQWWTLMAGELANVVITSPPYASQRAYDESSGFKPVQPDAYSDWWEPLQALVRAHMAADGSFFVNVKEHCEAGQRHLYVKDLVIRHVREWGWLFVDEFCWRDTKNGVPGGWQNRFKNAWEPVFHFATGPVKFRPGNVSRKSSGCFDYSADTARSSTGSGFKSGEPAGGTREGMARPSNVVEVAASGAAYHSAAYPVALPEFFIRAFSDAGDVILDPFLGSGTTLIAAARQGRVCYGMEISPAYCDVIRKRWTAYADQNDLDPGPGALR